MKNKILAIGSIMLTVISFFMMVDTKYFGSLGDYIIQGMGLKAWSGNCVFFYYEKWKKDTISRRVNKINLEFNRRLKYHINHQFIRQRLIINK
ncbi:hypothetical protein [Maledivibacter halophilus]|uniref:Uncharacterized protein n=1 Tax=Maledivibacter halophilus TaxID=36842 RepID=A0A1T5KSR4_9FIRM|nr:hypothetical protein [Maledivibacter halophilus]SKC66308.1 hypothetical protein SAMN02194393_02096 [Maledivibacter halophilus]